MSVRYDIEGNYVEPTNDIERARRKRVDAWVAAFCKEHGLVRETPKETSPKEQP